MTSLSLPIALPQLTFSRSRRVPMVFQSEAAECGLACLCMVANFHRQSVDMTSLRQQFSLSLRGASLKHLMEIASAMQLTPRALKVEPEHLKQVQLPCVLHWDMQHFVVLTKVTSKGIHINDPALGERRLNWQQVGNHFTGIALELSPAPGFAPLPAGPKLTLSHFWQRASGMKRSLLLLFGLSLLIQLFAIASPYYMQTVIDDVLVRQQRDLLFVLAAGFALLLLIETGTSVLRRILILTLSSKLQLQMSANVFHHLIHLPMSYFGKRHMGDIVSRFSSLTHIRELLTVGLVTALLDGLMALITLVVMAVYSPYLTLLVCMMMALYIALRLAMVAPMKRLTAERIATVAKEQSHFMESVRAIQAVKQFAQESQRQGQWQNRLAASINTDIRLGKWDISATCINQLLFGLENILVIYFAALLVMDNAMTVGMLYAFISYKNRFINSLDGLVTKGIEFRMLSVHFDRLADVVFCEKEPRRSTLMPVGVHDQKLNSPLIVKQLAYCYSHSEPAVFSEINLNIAPGSTIAIVGPSGSGKSTLLKCLMGLLTPTHGEVEYQGLSTSQSDWFRQNSASVMQDDHCLSGTIAQNITCFSETPDDDHMIWCAQQACIHNDILAMPMQYHTLVGDMGSSLSGGQLQRILLARALYRRPVVLFLDEASSHLDVVNEAAINQNLKQLSMTRIIVAHRPETIAMANQVYLLQSGRLAEVTPPATSISTSENSKNLKGNHHEQ